ncbi:hypothetical protein D3C84_272750 [compost metagenome]
MEHPPLLRLQREHRQEADGDDEQGEEDGGPHLYARLGDDAPAVLVGERLPLHVLVDVLDHHDSAIHHGADGDGDASQRHDVGVDPLQVHHDKGGQDGDGQGDDHHQGRAQVEQEGEANQHHHRELLQQLAGEIIDGALDKIGSVVDGDDLHPFRQAAFELCEPFLDPVYGVLGVLAETHDDDATDHFPFAVELGDAASTLGAGDHIRHVTQQQRGAAYIGTERDLLQILHALEVPVRAHHVLRFRHLDDGGAGLLVALLDGGLDKGERDAVGAQLVGIDPHLILAHHATHGGDLGDAVHRLQLVLEEPVLQRGELAQVMLAGSVHQRVLVDPAHPGGIGAELGAGGGGQVGCDLAQILQHPGAGPVEVGVVVKQHIDEGVAEEGVAAHRGGARHRQHGGGERIGDLILHHLGRLARVGRLDDHLHVGEIRQGVHRGLLDRPEPPGGKHDGQQQHQKAVAHGPANNRRDHDWAPCSFGAES